jgi:chromate transport protein ChrA
VPASCWPHRQGAAHHSRAGVRAAVADSCLLALSCLVSYWLATTILALAHSPSQADDLLGGMWAVIATVFVVRHSYHRSMAAAVSRMSATLVSFALCLAYLAFLPFHPWALAALISLSALAVTLLGRPGDSARPPLPPRSSWSRPNCPRMTPGSSPSCAWPTPRSGSR